MSERYLEDFAVGQMFGSGRLRIDKERILAFAAEFDLQPFHLDEAAAGRSVFGGLAASGWHTAAVTMRLMIATELKPAGGFVGAEVNMDNGFIGLGVMGQPMALNLARAGTQLIG